MPEAQRTTRPKRPSPQRRKWATRHADNPYLVENHSREVAYAHIETMREAQRLLHVPAYEIAVMVGPWGEPDGWEVHERVEIRE